MATAANANAMTATGPTPMPEQAKGVTVEEIISGTRCSPLTLKEFEGFLLHEERSVENLQFTVWYRAYCEKFRALPPEYRALSSPPEPFKQYANSSHAPSVTTAESTRSTGSGWLGRLIQRRASSKVALDEEARFGGQSAKISERYHEKEQRKATGGGDDLSSTGDDEDDMSLRSAAARIMGDAPKGAGTAFPTKPHPNGSKVATTTVPPAPAELLRTDSVLSGADSASVLSDDSEKRKKRFGNIRFANLAPIASMISRGEKDLPADTPLPFVEEIKLVMTTFLLPGANKELNIDARLRKHVLKYLRPAKEDGTYGEPITTHPDVFKEVADHCYELMEGSLPHYLQWAKGNINASKQAFWLAVGALDFGIGVMLNMLMLYYVRPRWARLAGWLFIQFGVMQFYSGSRYFCSQVHGRTARQLYPWEMSSEVSQGEHQAPTSNAFATKSTTTAAAAAANGEVSQKDKVKAELAASMPFLFEGLDSQPSTSTTSDETVIAMNTDSEKVVSAAAGGDASKPKAGEQRLSRTARAKKYIFRPRWKASWKSTDGKRMPVFGPERVVEDPYIKERHNKQIKEILIIGFIFVFCFESAMVAIPERTPL